MMRSHWPRFLVSLVAVLALVVVACAPAAPPTPTPAPPKPAAPAPAAQPTAAPKPAAPAPTAAPAKPAAPAPTAAPAKPAAPAPTAAPAKPAAKTLEKITARMSWIAYGGESYYFIAKEKGFYADEGLDVTIFEGTGGMTALQTVASGADQFSTNGPDALFKSISEGMPLKAVAGVFDKSPMGIVCQKGLNVTKPKDLEGKTMAITPGDSTLILFPVLLRVNKVDESKITKIAVDPAAKTNAVVAKRVDCATAWYNSSYVAMKQGADITFMRFSDYGLDPMGYRLFTSEQLIKDKPQIVRGFTRATIKGMQYMRENPDEGAALLAKQFPALKIEIAREQAKNSLPLFDSDNFKKNGLGYQDKAIYEKILDTFMEVGILNKKIDIATSFTNDFLK